MNGYLNAVYLSSTAIWRDHSFPRNMEFWAKPRNLHPVTAEFLRFCGILWNSAATGECDKMEYFGRVQVAVLITVCVCVYDFTMKYTTATWAVTAGIMKILTSAYLKYCQLSWQLPATNTAYLVGFRASGGRRKLIAICRKFAAGSCGIWQTGPRNLEKFAVDNCGP